MDAAVKQMIEGMKMGVDAQSSMISDKSLLKPIREVIARMEEIGNEPGMDSIKFQEKMQSEGLMERYANAMAKLSEVQLAGMDHKIAEMEKMSEELEPVDLKTQLITDLDVVIKPHRMVYNTSVKDSGQLPNQKKAYEALFALAEECKTIPEFNRRSLAEGHQEHLGQAATWDANWSSFKIEITHKQPDMITWALNALEITRDYPFPVNVVYALNQNSFENELILARRQNALLPFTCFTDALAEYLLWPHLHTEEQREKIHVLLGLSKEFNGWEMDFAFYRPYIRRRLEMGQENIAKEQGPDYLGLIPLIRAGWHSDAKYTPEEKKGFGDFENFPKPDPLPYPYRTGPVGGVELILPEPAFALPFDGTYPVRLTLTNHSVESRSLDTAKGLRCWIFRAEGEPIVTKTDAKLPAQLAPGQSVTFEGDLFAWGLPKVEELKMVAFDVGLVGDFTCDLAEKHSDIKKLTPFTFPNYLLEPFQGGVAVDPCHVMPHRPAPEYPFPIPVTG
ncbi:hypothetical protein KAU45_08615 [bacterium]|nr:hypothetical protein [bacterium]